MKDTKELAMDVIQSTLEESFVDATDKLHTLIAIKANNKLNEMREDVAMNLMETIKKKSN